MEWDKNYLDTEIGFVVVGRDGQIRGERRGERRVSGTYFDVGEPSPASATPYEDHHLFHHRSPTAFRSRVE